MQQMYSPMAQAVQSRGRGEDTMLVHMTPTEVNSLQGLALANGGSLTINPDTGLPEAGFLSKLLPTLIGAGLAATGVGAPLAALMVGAGSTAITGDISKGLMAGLGAFGGAGLAGAAGLGGSISQNAFGALGNSSGLFGANMGAGVTSAVPEVASNAATQAAQGAVPELTMDAANMGLADVGVPEVANTALQVAEPTARYAAQAGAETFSQAFNPEFMASLNAPAQAATAPFDMLSQVPGGMSGVGTGVPEIASRNFLQRFGDITQIPGAPDIVNKALPYAAGYAAIAPALEPEVAEMPEDEEQDYRVPIYGQREVMTRVPRGPGYAQDDYGGELTYFTPSSALLPIEDYRTVRMAEGDTVEAPAAGGLGSTSPASVLPEYVKMFQTSPGAITNVPYGYGEGQSPMELIRAQAAANTAAEQASAAERQVIADGDYTRNLITNEITTTQPSAAEITPSAPPAAIAPGAMEMDYGFAKAPPTPTGRYDYLTNPGRISPFGYPDATMYEMSRRSRDTAGMAEGGMVDMQEGGFVMPARETAEFGNGSTMAGQRRLAQMGGMPIRGSGDGVSDSIPARIDGQQRAAVADGETYFPPRAVKRLGGAEKLRAMMDKATQSRKRASRGGENKIRGLA